MRWTVMLVAEVELGQRIEHDIAAVDRDERITPATLGLEYRRRDDGGERAKVWGAFRRPPAR
jgi:hypothetical protein